MVAGTADFASPDEAARSPLAERLFQVDGVQRVFLGQDFISISKAPDKEWFVLKPAILGVITGALHCRQARAAGGSRTGRGRDR